MSGKRGNGEGSIYPYRNGFAAYVWVDTPEGKRKRKITVKEAYSAQVAGLTVYLEGTESQMMGNLVMGTSRALMEQVGFKSSPLGDVLQEALVVEELPLRVAHFMDRLRDPYRAAIAPARSALEPRHGAALAQTDGAGAGGMETRAAGVENLLVRYGVSLGLVGD